MLADLPKGDRLLLLRFVCSFAWTDLEVDEEERRFVRRLASRLDLDPEEEKQVSRWLQVPPLPEEVDPQDVPPEHRDLFCKALRAVAERDGVVNEEEALTLQLFDRLTR